MAVKTFKEVLTKEFFSEFSLSNINRGDSKLCLTN